MTTLLALALVSPAEAGGCYFADRFPALELDLTPRVVLYAELLLDLPWSDSVHVDPVMGPGWSLAEVPSQALLAADRVVDAVPSLRECEVDALVRAGDVRYPVTVRWEVTGKKGAVWLSWGAPLPIAQDGNDETERLANDWHVAAVVDGTANWTPLAIEMVAQAYSVLTPAEVDAVRDLDFWRERAPTSED